jgi:hypothetical protein
MTIIAGAADRTDMDEHDQSGQAFPGAVSVASFASSGSALLTYDRLEFRYDDPHAA